MLGSGLYYVQIDIGAFIHYLISGFAENYWYHRNKKYDKRNFWTGYVASILLFIFSIFIIYLFLK